MCFFDLQKAFDLIRLEDTSIVHIQIIFVDISYTQSKTKIKCDGELFQLQTVAYTTG